MSVDMVDKIDIVTECVQCICYSAAMIVTSIHVCDVVFIEY